MGPVRDQDEKGGWEPASCSSRSDFVRIYDSRGDFVRIYSMKVVRHQLM